MLPDGIRQSILKHLSLEQQKELLNKFNINNNEINTQTIAKQDNNITSNDKNNESITDSNNKSSTGQTAQELSELKVKQSDSSTFFKDTKKDLDKLLDTYT